MMYPLTNYHIPITYSCWNIGLHHKLSWNKLSPTKGKNTEKFEFFSSKLYLGYKFLTVLNIVSKFQEDWIRFEKVIAVYKTLTFGLTKMWTTTTTESMVAMSRLRDIRRRRDKNVPKKCKILVFVLNQDLAYGVKKSFTWPLHWW